MLAVQSKARHFTAAQGRVSETGQDKEEHGSCGKQGMTRQGKGHQAWQRKARQGNVRLFSAKKLVQGSK